MARSPRNKSGKKSISKARSRKSLILPNHVGHTFAVHNGSKFIPVYVTENMVGHKFEEFAPSRNVRRKNIAVKTSYVPTRHVKVTHETQAQEIEEDFTFSDSDAYDLVISQLRELNSVLIASKNSLKSTLKRIGNG